MNGPTGNPDLTFSRIIETARSHYENLKADIVNASNRIEHIRLTTLAQEAHRLLTDLEFFKIGMVYARTAALSPEDLERYMQIAASSKVDGSDLELDLPEFKSPFTPPSV
jgi:mRNA degradation ribonuclease J1/J2